jgi:hypothetical protein
LAGLRRKPGEVIWSIVCFFVPRRHRGDGLVRQLITGAVEHAKKHGATIVEAYPVDEDAPSYRFMGFTSVFAEGVEAWLRPVSIGLALFLVWLGYFFGGEAFRRLRDPKAPIAIGPAGLYDRAISGRPIPWNAIRDLHVWDGGARGGRCLVFDIEDNAARDAGVHLRVRNSAPVNRPFGYGYRVHTLGTNANIEALTQAIAPYATVKL